jgi:hypothetical protein
MNTDDRIRGALHARAHQAPHPDHAGAVLWHRRRTRQRRLVTTGVVAGVTTVALLGLTVLRSGGDAQRNAAEPSTTSAAVRLLPTSVAGASSSPTTSTSGTGTASTGAATTTSTTATPSMTPSTLTTPPTAPTTTPAPPSTVPDTNPPDSTTPDTVPTVTTEAVTTTAATTTTVADRVGPMGVCGLPATPAPTASGSTDPATLAGIRNSMVGRWIGTPQVPQGWFPIGSVWIDFRKDGTYASGCIEGNAYDQPAFVYGSNCDCSTNRYALVTRNSEGSAEGDIDISWTLDGAAPQSTRGQLHRVTVTATTLQFEFFRTWDGTYGPVVYDLQRA